MQQIFGAGMISFFFHLPLYMYLTWYLAVFGSVSEEGPCGMQVYADLFKENHITGKRLLLLTESDMRDMGVKSKGHIMHLKAIITVCNPHLMCSQQVYSQSCVLSPVGRNWETDSWLSQPGPFPSPAEGQMVLLLAFWVFLYLCSQLYLFTFPRSNWKSKWRWVKPLNWNWCLGTTGNQEQGKM